MCTILPSWQRYLVAWAWPLVSHSFVHTHVFFSFH